MTQTQAYDIPRSAGGGTLPGQPNPPQIPQGPRPGPWPGAPRYSPEELMGEVYLGLWTARVIPPGPMVDPERAVRAAADLLLAFGITPATAPAAGPQVTAAAVARVCAVAA
jgi:hypothetical protein